MMSPHRPDETLANIALALNTLNNNVSALAASMKTMGATLVELRRPNFKPLLPNEILGRLIWQTRQQKGQRTNAAAHSVTQDADPAIQALLNSDEIQPHVDNEDGELTGDDELLQGWSPGYRVFKSG